jgi:hypothetical protein
MEFPAYLGVKQSSVVRKGQATRLYTTAEVARITKLHKMVILRWMAQGEVEHPLHYCSIRRGVCWLWDDDGLKVIRSLARKKHKRALSGVS